MGSARLLVDIISSWPTRPLPVYFVIHLHFPTSPPTSNSLSNCDCACRGSQVSHPHVHLAPSLFARRAPRHRRRMTRLRRRIRPLSSTAATWACCPRRTGAPWHPRPRASEMERPCRVNGAGGQTLVAAWRPIGWVGYEAGGNDCIGQARQGNGQKGAQKFQ